MKLCKILLSIGFVLSGLSCKARRQHSDVKLVDAEDVDKMSPEWQQNLSGVVAYFHKGYGVCTAFHLSPTILVTAAHCFYRPDFVKVENLAIEEPGGKKAQPVGISYVHYGRVKQSWNDIGIVKLDPNQLNPAAQPRSYKLLKGIPPTAGNVRMVGFGDQRHKQPAGTSNFGKKKTGTNIIDGIHDGFIDILSETDSGNGEIAGQTSATTGDSGGPLFNDKLEVLGVFSTFTPDGTTDGKFLTSYVPISTPQSLYFIRNGIQSRNISIIPSPFFIKASSNLSGFSRTTDKVAAFAGRWYTLTDRGIVNQLSFLPYKTDKLADIKKADLSDNSDNSFAKFIVTGEQSFYASTRQSIRTLQPANDLINKLANELFPLENREDQIYDMAWFSGSLYVAIGKSLYSVTPDLSAATKIFTFEAPHTRLASDGANLYAVSNGSILRWNSVHNIFEVQVKSFFRDFYAPEDNTDPTNSLRFYKFVAIEGVLYMGTTAGIYVYRVAEGSRAEVYAVFARPTRHFDVDSKNAVLSSEGGIHYAHRLSPSGSSYLGSDNGCLTYDEQFDLTNYMIQGLDDERAKHLKNREETYRLCL